MPCNGGPPSKEEYKASAEAVMKREKEIQTKIDYLTRLLCTLIRGAERGVGLETLELSDKQIAELRAWMIEHDKWDKIRIEGLRESARAKLTDEEREALGL